MARLSMRPFPLPWSICGCNSVQFRFRSLNTSRSGRAVFPALPVTLPPSGHVSDQLQAFTLNQLNKAGKVVPLIVFVYARLYSMLVLLRFSNVHTRRQRDRSMGNLSGLAWANVQAIFSNSTFHDFNCLQTFPRFTRDRQKHISGG